jgi:hypothetical protein
MLVIMQKDVNRHPERQINRSQGSFALPPKSLNLPQYPYWKHADIGTAILSKARP